MDLEKLFHFLILLATFMCSSMLKVIDNLATLIDGVSNLPQNLKARILHLMQKRGLVTDENISKVCKIFVNWKSLDYGKTLMKFAK